MVPLRMMIDMIPLTGLADAVELNGGGESEVARMERWTDVTAVPSIIQSL
jgi:hypothetical protein